MSKSTTMEILDILITHQGEEITNDQLPVSSYTKQRNQMVGKIVLPLKEITKELLKRELHLECTGSLYEFTLSLQEKVIKVGIIKEI